MANFFPCPNPACTYQFDADQLPAAAMVTCPICRTRFPYRAAAPAAASPSYDDGQEESFGGASSAASDARERPNRLVSPRNVPTGSNMQTALMLMGFTLVVVAVLAIVYFAMKGKTWFGKPGEVKDDYANTDFNFIFSTFDKEKWPDEPDLKDKFRMNAFMRKSPDLRAWIGLQCIHLGGKPGIREPREGELEAAFGTILKNFTEVTKGKPINGTMGGQPATIVQFNGNMKDGDKDTPIVGEGYLFHNKGLGYVMIMWAAQDKWDSAKSELAALRDTFKFASERNNWKGSSSIYAYYVDDGDYQVEDASGLWQRATPDGKPDKLGPRDFDKFPYSAEPKEKDPFATMVFRCLHPEDTKKKKGNRREFEAEAMVLVLPKGGDSVDDVKNYLNKALDDQEEGNSKYSFEPYQKLPFDFDMPPSTASVGTFKRTNSVDTKAKKFYAISVKKINDHVVAVVAWCAEENSEVMGPYVVRLAASLKERQ